MQNNEMKKSGWDKFEERVRQVSGKGPLLTYSCAGYVSGLSRARLRQLVDLGTLEIEKVNGQRMIVLGSLIQYREELLRQKKTRPGREGRDNSNP